MSDAPDSFLKEALEYLASAPKEEVIAFIESLAEDRPEVADALKSALKARLDRHAS